MTPKQKQKHIKEHAAGITGYLLDDGREFDDFKDQYADEYWDDATVETTLGLKRGSLTEEMAAVIASDLIYDGTTGFVEVLAYNSNGVDHVYVDAIKLAVLLRIRKVPKLLPGERKYLLDLLKPEAEDA